MAASVNRNAVEVHGLWLRATEEIADDPELALIDAACFAAIEAGTAMADLVARLEASYQVVEGAFSKISKKGLN